jgi:hypothetical protein
MRKAGKVINIEKDKVYIITTNKEFVTIEKHTVEPTIGELYAGEEFQRFKIWKYLLAVTCILLLLFLTIKLYLDNKHNFSVIVDMNCLIKMEVTSSNEIKKVEGINSKGRKINELLDLEHKSLEVALGLILDESIKQKYLTKAHADDGFEIPIFVSDNKNNPTVNFTNFEKHANKQNFKVIINNSEQSIIK